MKLKITSLFALALMGCTSGWPSPPPNYAGELPSQIDGEATILEELRKPDRGSKYPTKYYWHEAPNWIDDSSPLGNVTGRHTDNTPIVQLRRLDGSPEGWQDMCVIKIVSIKQVLNAGEFGRTKTSGEKLIQGRSSSAKVDCEVYDNYAVD